MSWLNKLLGRGELTSRQVAKDRLQMVLIHDRSNLSPGMLEALKDEIIATIGKRVNVDPSQVSFKLEQDGRTSRLVADIPINLNQDER
jgi:cell division topological specificity factor